MLELTSDAAWAIDRLLSDRGMPDGAGIRIESAGPAPSNNGDRPEGGALRLVLATEASNGDDVVEQDGTRLFIEPDVSPFLDDKLLDVSTDGAAVQFVLAEQN